MKLNISQLIDGACFATWFSVAKQPQHTFSKHTKEVIMTLLRMGKPLTCEELTRKGKFRRIGCKSHVGTILIKLHQARKIYRVAGGKPYKYTTFEEL